MPPAKAALQREPDTAPRSTSAAIAENRVPPRLPNVIAGGERIAPSLKPVTSRPAAQRQEGFSFQPRIPAITGEANYRGYLPVDGVISGQLNASGGALLIKQRPRNGRVQSEPELNGEISFKDMLRINGHVAGKLFSQKGTLIVDTSAVVDASVEVGVAVIGGTVNGDVVGHQKVELGHGAVINGNISTRSLIIKPGAVFHGECRMLKNDVAE